MTLGWIQCKIMDNKNCLSLASGRSCVRPCLQWGVLYLECLRDGLTNWWSGSETASHWRGQGAMNITDTIAARRMEHTNSMSDIDTFFHALTDLAMYVSGWLQLIGQFNTKFRRGRCSMIEVANNRVLLVCAPKIKYGKWLNPPTNMWKLPNPPTYLT
jgi:hypothetical protein